MDRKRELLTNTLILSRLNKKELDTFSNLCASVDYTKDAIIFEEGDKSKSFFIVDSGEVKIIHTTEDNRENVLAYFIPGEIFGEFDLFENDPRTATAIANTDLRLLVFPKPELQFERLYKDHPDIFVKICHNLITTNAKRIRQTNKLVSEKTSWIEDLKNQMLIDKLTGFYNKSYLENEFPTIMAQQGSMVSIAVVKPDNFKAINDTFGHEAGDRALKEISSTVRSHLIENEMPVRYRGNEFIVIYNNTALSDALKKSESLHAVLTGIDIGKLIGDTSLSLTYSMGIAMYPDHADTIAGLVDIAYSKLFEKRDSGGNGILFVDKREENILDFLKSVKAFSSLTRSELNQISKYLKPVTKKSGEILCKEGEEGNELFIIESGLAAVTIKLQEGSDKELTQFSSGDFFGEMSIFENEKRSATCTAREDSKILILYKDDFLTFMKKKPVIAIKIMREMLDITSGRLSNTSRFLSDMVRWGEEASKRAITDALTGLYNRRYLDSSLEEQFGKAKQGNLPLSLIMADLDYFRDINEGYSHEIGDKYIVEVANVFKQYFRETDIVARFGGDEFTILLPETTLQQASEIAEKIRVEVVKLDFLKQFTGPPLKPSTSMGIAAYPENCDDLNTLKEFADKALYKAKEGGRNRVVCSDERPAAPRTAAARTARRAGQVKKRKK